MNISFIGSGITIYGIRLGASNFTVSVDGEEAPPPILVPPLLQDSPAIYNVTLYDIQLLTLSPHSFVLYIVGWDIWPNSELFVDYAYVNETDPFKTSSGSRQVVGAAIGGTLGGLAVVGVVFILLHFRKRKRAPPAVIDTQPNQMPFDPYNNTNSLSPSVPPLVAVCTPMSPSSSITTGLYPNRLSRSPHVPQQVVFYTPILPSV